MDRTCRIVITGPESSGKSWLCENLSRHFHAPWVHEYARFYLEEHGSKYEFDTLGKMAKEHYSHQARAVARAKELIFLDTDLLNYLIWEKLVFGKVHSFITQNIPSEKDHRYLVAYPDIPWEADPLRENPENREELFEMHIAEIEKRKRPYRIVKGTGKARLENAIIATKELLSIPC